MMEHFMNNVWAYFFIALGLDLLAIVSFVACFMKVELKAIVLPFICGAISVVFWIFTAIGTIGHIIKMCS